MPIRSSTVAADPAFQADLLQLTKKYTEIDSAIDEFSEILKCGFHLDLVQIPVDPSISTRVYAHRMDYPPLGASGRGKFLVIYHATDPGPSPTKPYQQITLLRLIDLPPAG